MAAPTHSMRIRRGGSLFLAVVGMSFVLVPGMLRAQTSQEVASRLKAVYLLQFLQFVEWPDSAFANADAPVVVGVLEADPFIALLRETVMDEKVGDRPIALRRVSDVNAVRGCHALYVGSSGAIPLGQVLQAAEDASVLTVSDQEGFDEAGGGITFFLEHNKLRFAINLQTMRVAGLRVSSKLLRLARVIDPL